MDFNENKFVYIILSNEYSNEHIWLKTIEKIITLQTLIVNIFWVKFRKYV